MSKVLNQHGDEIAQQMNCVVGYNVTGLRGTENEVTILLDMREKAENKCLILKSRAETADQVQSLGISQKPDMCFVMTEKVFEQMERKEMTGFVAFVKGVVGIRGSVMLSGKFSSQVINKYVPNCDY